MRNIRQKITYILFISETYSVSTNNDTYKRVH